MPTNADKSQGHCKSTDHQKSNLQLIYSWNFWNRTQTKAGFGEKMLIWRISHFFTYLLRQHYFWQPIPAALLKEPEVWKINRNRKPEGEHEEERKESAHSSSPRFSTAHFNFLILHPQCIVLFHALPSYHCIVPIATAVKVSNWSKPMSNALSCCFPLPLPSSTIPFVLLKWGPQMRSVCRQLPALALASWTPVQREAYLTIKHWQFPSQHKMKTTSSNWVELV